MLVFVDLIDVLFNIMIISIMGISITGRFNYRHVCLRNFAKFCEKKFYKFVLQLWHSIEP